jgi:uncharacterized phiE125 gp8 family phage protein
MHNLTLITPPESEPVTTTEMTQALGIGDCDSTDANDIAYIEALITSAREYCEDYQHRAFLTQTWELSMDEFPFYEIKLPKGNLQSITSIKYVTEDLVVHTMTPTMDYLFSTRGIIGRIVPNDSWTTEKLTPLDGVRIVFVCGYATVAQIPKKTIQAIRLLVSHWYNNRTPLDDVRTAPQEIAFSLTALLDMDRLVML